MSQIKIGIVEDEVIIAENLINTLIKLGYETTEPASSYEEAIQIIDKEQPDLVLLDIQIEGQKDGIEVAHYINQHWHLPFIFLTANTDPATVQRAKAASPLAYLAKPFTKDDLYTAIEICFDNFEKRKLETAAKDHTVVINDAVFIKDGNYFHKIKYNEVLYLEADNMYVIIRTTNKKILVRKSLQKVLENFDRNSFIQIHRKFIINLHHLETINSDKLFVGGHELPLSRNYKEAVLSKLKLS